MLDGGYAVGLWRNCCSRSHIGIRTLRAFSATPQVMLIYLDILILVNETMMTETLTDELGPIMASREAADLAELLQALGDPTRLRILSVLDTVCAPVGVIAATVGLRQSAVSHHLRVLRDRGVLRAERRGTSVYYCAKSDALRPAIEAVRSLLNDRSVQ